jgi:hypothetical protein
MKRCFKVSKGHPKSFSVSCASKKRLGWSRLSDVLRRRTSLRTHNLISGRLKKDFGEVDEVMFQGVEGLIEKIFCISGIEYIVFDEVGKWFFK